LSGLATSRVSKRSLSLGLAPVVIRDASGDALVPSVVSIDEQGTVFVGREAQRRLLTATGRTVYSVKRFMGRGIEDVRDDAEFLRFRVAGEAGGVVRIRTCGRSPPWWGAAGAHRRPQGPSAAP